MPAAVPPPFVSPPVRIVVDLELCQGHAVCQEEAPTVFRVRERAGGYARVELLQAEPPDVLRAQVLAAVRYCPNRVLSILEEK